MEYEDTMTTTIEDIKKLIDSDRIKESEKYQNVDCIKFQAIVENMRTRWAYLDFKSGHEAATSRLLPIIEKALEMFQDTEESLININENMAHYYANQCCPNIDEVNEVLIAMRKAREFQAFLAELAAGGSND